MSFIDWLKHDIHQQWYNIYQYIGYDLENVSDRKMLFQMIRISIK